MDGLSQEEVDLLIIHGEVTYGAGSGLLVLDQLLFVDDDDEVLHDPETRT
jgi:hypothetical protein